MERPEKQLDINLFQTKVPANSLQFNGFHGQPPQEFGGNFLFLERASSTTRLRLINLRLAEGHFLQFAKLKQLISIEFHQCALPENAVEQLRASLPNCSVKVTK